MARKKREWYEGASYHVMGRGNRKCAIFKEREDYTLFMMLLCSVKERFPFDLCTLDGKSIPPGEFLSAVSREFNFSYSWIGTGEADERDPVDDRLIEWPFLFRKTTAERIWNLHIKQGFIMQKLLTCCI